MFTITDTNDNSLQFTIKVPIIVKLQWFPNGKRGPNDFSAPVQMLSDPFLVALLHFTSLFNTNISHCYIRPNCVSCAVPWNPNK